MRTERTLLQARPSTYRLYEDARERVSNAMMESITTDTYRHKGIAIGRDEVGCKSSSACVNAA